MPAKCFNSGIALLRCLGVGLARTISVGRDNTIDDDVPFNGLSEEDPLFWLVPFELEVLKPSIGEEM
jgi:hypothetical protein